MVYCTKCATQNPDEAAYCIKCGAALEVAQRERWEKREKGEGPECFGVRWSGRDWGLLWGIIIILAGVIWLSQQYIPQISWGGILPFIVIAFGVIIIIKVLSRPRT